jgi:hypothetical protein
MTAPTDENIAQTYVNYYCNGGSKSDYWAVEELSQLAIEEPLRVWKIIQAINTIPVEDENWRKSLYATVGCGPLEDIIVIHESHCLPEIIEAAAEDRLLREELSAIYESSVSQNAWAQIQKILTEEENAERL